MFCYRHLKHINRHTMWLSLCSKRHRSTLICNQLRGINRGSVSATHSAANQLKLLEEVTLAALKKRWNPILLITLSSTLDSIQAIEDLTKVCDIHRFTGLVNYYSYMWGKCANTLPPPTNLFSTKFKFKWNGVEKNSFMKMKKRVGRDVLISYNNFSEEFIIHTDTIRIQLGGVVIQNGKPIKFYLWNLTPVKINYTTTEIELPSIVETLKTFCTVILGHHITVNTNHKNLTYENFTMEIVLHCHLLLE